MKTKFLFFGLFFLAIGSLVNAQSWQAGTDILYANPTTTKIGIGVTTPSTPLYLGNGDNSNGVTKPQIGFGWNGTSNYTHWILTRHDLNTNMYNAIDFYLWEKGQTISDLGSNLMMSITGTGVGIGVSLPSAELEVDGKIICEEVEVKDVSADYVFEKGFSLKTLNEVEAFINKNGHLPDVPPASETEKGVNLSEFNSILLQKIEELTLYTIEQEKKIEELQNFILNQKQ